MKKVVSILLLLFTISTAFTQETKFKHILITNDDGIKDLDKLMALAVKVKPLAQRVSILVSTENRSASSNYYAYGSDKKSYEVKTVSFNSDLNIGVYTIPDYPADCVMLGLGGLFKDERPDFVLSGINSGNNVGIDWIGSGTIGAVRMAAFLGVRGIAFSGFNTSDKSSFELIPSWIAAFLKTPIVDKMNRYSYLAIEFPRIPLDQIQGVKISKKRIGYDQPEMVQSKKIYGDKLTESGSKTIWIFEPIGNPDTSIEKDDVYYVKNGYIVITPMTLDENNESLSKEMSAMETMIPKFNN